MKGGVVLKGGVVWGEGGGGRVRDVTKCIARNDRRLHDVKLTAERVALVLATAHIRSKADVTKVRGLGNPAATARGAAASRHNVVAGVPSKVRYPFVALRTALECGGLEGEERVQHRRRFVGGRCDRGGGGGDLALAVVESATVKRALLSSGAELEHPGISGRLECE